MALVAVTAALAGCATPEGTGPATPVPASPVAPTPSASDLVAAVTHTRGLGTAAVDISVRTDADGAVRTLDGSGGIDLGKGYGDLLWRADDDSPVRELSNGKGLYVQSEVPTGTWARLPDVRSTPTGPLADPLRGLGTLQGVAESDASIDPLGRRFTGTQPASTEALQLLGLTDEERTGLGDAWQRQPIDVTVWIDDARRVVRVDRSAQFPGGAGDAVRALTSTTLSDFSRPLDLTSPPSGSVVEGPDPQ